MIALLVYLAETAEYYKIFFATVSVVFLIMSIVAFDAMKDRKRALMFIGGAILSGFFAAGIPEKESVYKIIAAMDRERGTITIHGEIK